MRVSCYWTNMPYLINNPLTKTLIKPQVRMITSLQKYFVRLDATFQLTTSKILKTLSNLKFVTSYFRL